MADFLGGGGCVLCIHAGLGGKKTEKSGAKGGDTGTTLSDPPLMRGGREKGRKKWERTRARRRLCRA